MENFYIEKKIYYHDTDLAGIVYYANYLKYMEEARTEYFSAKGIDFKKLFEEEGIQFLVMRVEIDYKAPARYRDVIRIFTEIESVKFSVIKLFQKITKDNITLAEARSTFVCVGRNLKPISIPEEIQESLTNQKFNS